jgi:hypothetical protein
MNKVFCILLPVIALTTGNAASAANIDNVPEWSVVRVASATKACYWDNGPTNDCIDLIYGEEAVVTNGRTENEVCMRPIRLVGLAPKCYWARWTCPGRKHSQCGLRCGGNRLRAARV